MKKYQFFFFCFVFFLSENFQLLEVKFSIYLNRRVFVMWVVRPKLKKKKKKKKKKKRFTT